MVNAALRISVGESETKSCWIVPTDILPDVIDGHIDIEMDCKRNKDALWKSGNMQEHYQKLQYTISSGSNKCIDSIKKGIDPSSSGGGGGLEKYLKMVPGGSEIILKSTQM